MTAGQGAHLLFFQNGDYAEAFRRFRDGGAETYGGQKFTVGFVEALAQTRPVTVLTWCDRPHDEQLTPGLRSIGIDTAGAADGPGLRARLTALAPDLVICRSPNHHVLGHCRAADIPTMPMFADTFANTSLKMVWRNLRMRWLLSGKNVPGVANHSLNATRSLGRALAIPARRLAPWDWPPLVPDPDPKPARPTGGPFSAIYAGALSIPKGVGDCLAASALLRDQGFECRLSFAGPGDLDFWRAEATRLGIADRVRFLGPVANAEVRGMMRAHDAVLVPSRHEYGEGLPKTLLEGFASRSPLIVSDHPAFASRVRDGQTCLMYRGGDPASLAARIRALDAAPALYRALSEASADALASLYIGIEWPRLVETFLADPRNTTGWVARHSLAALR